MLIAEFLCLLVCLLNSRDVQQKEADAELFNKSDEQLLNVEGNKTEQQVTEKDESIESSFTQIMERETPVEITTDQKSPVEKTTEQKLLEEKITTQEISVEKTTELKTLKVQAPEQKIPIEKITELKSHVELKEHEKEKQELVIKLENDKSTVLQEENEASSQITASSTLLQPCKAEDEKSIQSSFKEESAVKTSSNNDSQESIELSIKVEGMSSASEKNVLSFETESTKTEQEKDAPENVDDSTMECASNEDDEVILIKLEPQRSFPSTEENKNSNDGSVCDSNSSEVLQEQSDSVAIVTVAPKTETNTSLVASKPSESSHKIKTSKGPKIKRTLSRAERLSRTRKAKSALTLKMGLSLKGSPSAKQQGTPGVSVPSKAETPGVSLPLKGATPVKASIKSEKPVQRRRSFKGGRPSSVSPRGYGYSMAFMDIEKPSLSGVKTEEEGEVPTTDSGLGLLKISTQSTTCTTTSPTSPTTTTAGTPTENQAAPKKQAFQAKKFRLDQITGKLSAQRQSEAQAAAHSPSAFQLTKHHSSPPPPPALSPSPPANPPYPREPYPPPGPPPLLYSPMPGSCCPAPHHQRMYGPHPGHGMHLPTGHMHPHPEYPPPSSGYMLYAHGMHYPPHGPCMGQCKYNYSIHLN